MTDFSDSGIGVDYGSRYNAPSESLSPEELRETLSCIVRLAECLVCHETLTPKVVLCVTGHAVCEPCHQRLQNKHECPLCRGPISADQPTLLIRQLIEALPHPCRHKNCDYFVRPSDDHETFCTFKPTKCRVCEWSGAEQGLAEHVFDKHLQQFGEYYLPIVGSLVKGVPFNPKTTCSVTTPFIVDGHFFWLEMRNEPNAGKLTAIFQPVGNGKVTADFHGSLKLGPKGGFNVDIKLNMDPEVDSYKENCISIPTSVLHKYTVKDKLDYRITVEIIRLESLVTFVLSGIKSVFTK